MIPFIVTCTVLLIILTIVANKHDKLEQKMKKHIKNGDIVPSDMAEPLNQEYV